MLPGPVFENNTPAQVFWDETVYSSELMDDHSLRRLSLRGSAAQKQLCWAAAQGVSSPPHPWPEPRPCSPRRTTSVGKPDHNEEKPCQNSGIWGFPKEKASSPRSLTVQRNSPAEWLRLCRQSRQPAAHWLTYRAEARWCQAKGKPSSMKETNQNQKK